MNNYDDIINLPHPEPRYHQRMTRESRSSQFAPFAALTGHADAIKETERLTTKRIEIDDSLKMVLNDKLQIILDNINNKPKITFTYFVYDSKKSGGKYIDMIGNVRKIDTVNGLIYLSDKSIIPIMEIIDIKGELFNNMYD